MTDILKTTTSDGERKSRSLDEEGFFLHTTSAADERGHAAGRHGAAGVGVWAGAAAAKMVGGVRREQKQSAVIGGSSYKMKFEAEGMKSSEYKDQGDNSHYTASALEQRRALRHDPGIEEWLVRFYDTFVTSRGDDGTDGGRPMIDRAEVGGHPSS